MASSAKKCLIGVGVLLFLCGMVGLVVLFNTPGAMEALLFDPRALALLGGGGALVYGLVRVRALWFLRLQRPLAFHGVLALAVGLLFYAVALPSVLVGLSPEVQLTADSLRAVRLNATAHDFKVMTWASHSRSLSPAWLYLPPWHPDPAEHTVTMSFLPPHFQITLPSRSVLEAAKIYGRALARGKVPTSTVYDVAVTREAGGKAFRLSLLVESPLSLPPVVRTGPTTTLCGTVGPLPEPLHPHVDRLTRAFILYRTGCQGDVEDHAEGGLLALLGASLGVYVVLYTLVLGAYTWLRHMKIAGQSRAELSWSEEELARERRDRRAKKPPVPSGALHLQKEMVEGRLKPEKQEFVKEFLCPLLREVMVDPVSTVDGHTFERCAIEIWVKKWLVSPVTHKPLRSLSLVDNKDLFSRINSEEYRRWTAPASNGPVAAAPEDRAGPEESSEDEGFVLRPVAACGQGGGCC